MLCIYFARYLGLGMRGLYPFRLIPFRLIPFRLIPFRLTKGAGVPNVFLMQIMVHLLFEYPVKSFDCSLECLVVPRGSFSVL